MKFRFVHDERCHHSIASLCKVMSISESGYYAWRKRPISQRQREDMVLLAHIKTTHEANYKSYGRQRMTKDLIIDALNKAIALRKPPKGVIFHSDRRSQYCPHKFRKILAKNEFKQSVSGKGNCYDNAAVETFFKTLKAEMVWKFTFKTRDQAKNELFKYINGFYNPRRRHSYLNGLSPIKFERRAA